MESHRAVGTFSALAHETRLAVFRLLVKAGPAGMAAGDIARALGTPANSMSTSLAILERAGLVAGERRGRSIVYRADLEGARDLLLYLVQDCCNGNPAICASVAEVVEAAGGCAPDVTAAREKMA